MRAAEVTITGRVQGVGYRFAAVRRARELGLRGWVRNARDGTVRALIIGDDSAVAQMLDWCSSGPPAALVANVHAVERHPNVYADVTDFDLLP